MNLSPAAVHEILFPPFEYQNIRPLTYPGDVLVSRVYIVSAETGLSFKAEDPDERWWHVEIYTAGTLTYCELWPKTTWEHSLTKRYKFKPSAHIGDGIHSTAPDPLITKLHEVEELLLRHLIRECRFHVSIARQSVEILIRSPLAMQAQLREMIMLPLDIEVALDVLREKLIEHAKQNEQENENQPPAEETPQA